MQESVETILDKISRAYEEDRDALANKKITLEERIESLEIYFEKLQSHVMNLYKHFLGR